MIDLIGAPFDLCGRSPGSRLGPAAIRLAGLEDELAALGLEVHDGEDAMVLPDDPDLSGLRNFGPLLSFLTEVQQRAGESLDKGNLPLVIGGDHSVALGGISAALAKFDGDLAVLWIDAHADLNTPSCSDSGNLHGMPLSALAQTKSGGDHLRDVQWNELLRRLGPTALSGDRMAWIGLRDVDLGEREAIKSFGKCFPSTMQDIDRLGVVAVIERFDAWMRASGATRLWISFDVDVFDPVLAPGTGTAVRGGLDYREGALIAELLRENLDAEGCPYSLVGLDLVETNPIHDINNETATVAVQWVASLFGKTILSGGGI